MEIEKKTGETILQHGVEWFEIGGRRYAVGKPSVATVIMVSELIGDLPVSDVGVDPVGFVLRSAKDMRVLGRIGALLILGAKSLRKGWFGWWRRRSLDRLSESLLEEWSSGELLELVTDRLGAMDLGSFFVLTTSLASANVLRSTSGVVE